MHSNRPVLRATENRLPLQKSASIDLNLPTKLFKNVHPQPQQQQENLLFQTKNSLKPRPILTAVRTIRQQSKENETCTEMLISPMVKTNICSDEKPVITQPIKTREQLEEDLYELPDYRESIFEHLKSVETLYAPKKNFMEQQSDINAAMRTILVDWLIEVSDEYKLHDETLFLAVQYVDRFLSTVNVTRSKLQLLGTTCAYIAAKYEEMYPPALEEFSFITDNTYETKHILRMEQIVIKMLNFSLSSPTAYTFLQYYLTHLKPLDKDDDHHQSVAMLAKYLCTLTLLHDQPLASYRPSLIAASCLLFSFHLLNPKFDFDQLWSTNYVQLTTYTYDELKECLKALVDLHSQSYQQEKLTSSLLRRYLNSKKESPAYQRIVREIIHHSKHDEDGDEDDILDLTLDEYEEDNNMSLDLHR